MLRHAIASVVSLVLTHHAFATTLEELAQQQLEYEAAQVQAKTSELKNKGSAAGNALQAVPSTGQQESRVGSPADDIYVLGIYALDDNVRTELQIGKNKVTMRMGMIAHGWKLESIEDSVVTLVGAAGKNKGVRRQAVFGGADAGPSLFPAGYSGTYPNAGMPGAYQPPMPGVAPRIGP